MTLPISQKSQAGSFSSAAKSAEAVAVTVCIPTHRRPANVIRLLKSLHGQALAGGFEIIVVSNFFDLILESLLKTNFPNGFGRKISLKISDRLGVNAARNLGIEFAKAPILVFLDDDCILDDARFLSNHLEYHQRYSSATCIGGPYRMPSGSRGACEIAYQVTSDFWLEGALLDDSKTQSLVGGNLSLKLAKLDQNLRFNEDIDFGGSETEFELRLFSAGHELRYFRDLSLVHNCEIGWSALIYKAFKQGVTSRRIECEYGNADVGFVRGPSQLALFLKSRINKPRLSLMLAVRLFQSGFEYGQNHARNHALKPSSRGQLVTNVLVYFLKQEFVKFFKSSIFPGVREFLYLSRVRRGPKR